MTVKGLLHEPVSLRRSELLKTNKGHLAPTNVRTKGKVQHPQPVRKPVGLLTV